MVMVTLVLIRVNRTLLAVVVAAGILLGVLPRLAACDTEDPNPPPSVFDPNPGDDFDATFGPAFDASAFPDGAEVNHPYFPLTPGTTYRYEGETEEGFEEVVTEVTNDTREVAGVIAVVVHDRAFLDGDLIEDTYDWYAQDEEGNVWYLGEETCEIEDGECVSTAGSWEAGVDSAQAGIIMPADPEEGQRYYQEYYEGEAEDRAEVVSTDEDVAVPYGSFSGCVQTLDTTPLEPDVREHKYYCSGVGLVREVDLRTGEVVELVGEDDGDGEPTITITDAEDSRISGRVGGTILPSHRVVLWAKTDRWYVQPFVADPYTEIIDGEWSSFTHPWSRIVALLIDETYEPGATRSYHPAADPGVIAWDECSQALGCPDPSYRTIDFSGFTWEVKSAEEHRAGPGPNYFSDDESDIFADGDGLHLRTVERDGTWYATEVLLRESLGYGRYTFQLSTRVDNLAYKTVFAGFIYESNEREVDVEFSRFLAAPQNAQYVVQPYTVEGNLHTFDQPAANETTHRFIWSAESLIFESWEGYGPNPTSETAIDSWTYTGDYVPPAGGESFHFNLWLFDGLAPEHADEVVVRSFSFEPL